MQCLIVFNGYNTFCTLLDSNMSYMENYCWSLLKLPLLCFYQYFPTINSQVVIIYVHILDWVIGFRMTVVKHNTTRKKKKQLFMHNLQKLLTVCILYHNGIFNLPSKCIIHETNTLTSHYNTYGNMNIWTRTTMCHWLKIIKMYSKKQFFKP